MIKTKWVLVWSFILLFKIATASLVAHSQGVAASAGIADVLIENGYKVEASYNIATKQPGDIKFNSKVGRVVQYGSKKDIIAPQSTMKGNNIERWKDKPLKDGPIQGHLLSNYGNIFTQPKGSDGYVAPRKDTKENGMGFCQAIMLLTIFLSGCKSKKEQKGCFENKQEEYRQNRMHSYLRKSLEDSLKSWISKDLKLRGQTSGISYSFNRTRWKISNIVLFNKDMSRAILSILNIENEGRLDGVRMIAAEKRNEKWWFYYVSMPSISFDRERDNNNKPYTFKQLSEQIVEEYIEGGYFKKGTCKIDYWYIDGWFDEEGRDLYKWHQEFLNSQGIYKTDDTDSVSTNSYDKN